MGDRGRVLTHYSSTDGRWILRDIDDTNSDLQQKKLTQEEEFELADKLFKFDMNLKGTFYDDKLRNREIVIHEN